MRAYPKSVHAAYPGLDYQVEVFDPTPAAAMQTVAAGHLASLGPRGSTPATSATAASVADLRSLARRLGHPIYWAGQRPGYTYELTQNPAGAVFIRYLPPGVAVGAKDAYLTVATYPFPQALAAIRRVAKGNEGRRDQAPRRRTGSGRRSISEEHSPRLPAFGFSDRGLRLHRRRKLVGSLPRRRSFRSPDRALTGNGAVHRLARLSARPRRALAGLWAAGRAGGRPDPAGSAPPPARARAPDRGGRPGHDDERDRPARDPAGRRAGRRRLRARPAAAREEWTAGLSAAASVSSRSTRRRSSSPGGRRLRATSRSTTPPRGSR